MMLELEGLGVSYGDLTAVEDVSLCIEEGELFCLLGPSGSGKSTVLRTIAGFERPCCGRITLGDTDVTEHPPYDRACSMVFQDWALFPQKTVLENVAFGQKMAGIGRAERHEQARETLELVEMSEYADSTPGQLSGGQKQRVALARSLAVDPDLLLLDEPLSNLDRLLRETMQLELKQIHERIGTAMLYVTHDQEEAFTLADRMGVMSDGELVQVGVPENVYQDPTDRFVESFLGTTKFVECEVAAAGDHPLLETPLGVSFRAPIDASVRVGDSITVSLRPERLAVGSDPEALAGVNPRVGDGGSGAVRVTGSVAETVHRGSHVRVRLSVGDATLFVERPVRAARTLSVGDEFVVEFEPSEAVYFDSTGERCR
ncbi:MAG: ABC transporter ATP-binding protein [Natronomonas sp.]|uniref:ABC transporter ATP-binding protein n=1 Tax=Natronomonas sp. TaxID=2184060 RepID=UPI00286FCAA9|nr:ABC transporter ATP-binding protein [Natronomonas sp.]MDR9431016.1 ABC transporter ATP-binding protein [Natronomonas sp.]